MAKVGFRGSALRELGGMKNPLVGENSTGGPYTGLVAGIDWGLASIDRGVNYWPAAHSRVLWIPQSWVLKPPPGLWNPPHILHVHILHLG